MFADIVRWMFIAPLLAAATIASLFVTRVADPSPSPYDRWSPKRDLRFFRRLAEPDVRMLTANDARPDAGV